MTGPARTCEGCGGSGQADPRPKYCPWCSTVFCMCLGQCGACLGSGIIVDSITSKDAEADGETLRSEWQRQALSVSHYTDATRPVMTGVLGDKLLGAPDPWELTAARAAFRAVPALKGE